jgi:serine/threonine protein kinase
MNSLSGQSIKFESGEVTLTAHLETTTTEYIYETNENTIIKYIPLFTTHSREIYQNESTSLRVLNNSPNIVRLRDFTVLQSTPAAGILKLEKCRSSLKSLLKNHTFNDEQVLFFANQVITGLCSIQQAGLVHRNLNPNNVLVSENYSFCISGLGSAAFIQDLLAIDPGMVSGFNEKISHPLARPPEFGKILDLEKIDTWALGCLLFFVIFRRYPDRGTGGQREIREVRNSQISNLLSRCLTANPAERPAPNELYFEINCDFQFNLITTSASLQYPRSGFVVCLSNSLTESTTPIDNYYQQVVTSKSWIKPGSKEKILSFLSNYDKKCTIPSIKFLIIVHRLIISGSPAMLQCKPILEENLSFWEKKQRDPRDMNYNEYNSGLIRQFSRVLLEKINFHVKFNNSGNWKQMLAFEHVDEAIQYLARVIKICEGLMMGMQNLTSLNISMKNQLLEESQRALGNISSVFSAYRRPLDPLNPFIEKITNLMKPVAEEVKPIIPSKSYATQVREEVPNFPQLIIQEKAKPENYLEDRWRIKQEELKMEKVLAGGSSCTVYKGKFKCTPVAIKIMRGTFMGKSMEKEFEREVKAMVSLRHPNLVLFMGACQTPQMIIVSEFCAGGSLFTLLHESKNLAISWKQKLKMIKDVARGMLYLHEAPSPILHRDLKSLNLLLVKQFSGPNDSVYIKITDFGVARILEQSMELTGQMGTCHWMAPEVLSNQPYSLEADIYSFAIVMWEILAREVPYNNINPMTIPIRVVKGERPNISQIPSTCPTALKDLIRQCWDQVPAKRPNFHKILDVIEALDDSQQ